MYLDKENLASVKTFTEFLDKNGLQTIALDVENDDLFEIHLKQGTKIMFKRDQTAASLINTIELLIKNSNLFAAGQEPLEYIDLRFGNKIYYKRVGDNTEVSL